MRRLLGGLSVGRHRLRRAPGGRHVPPDRGAGPHLPRPRRAVDLLVHDDHGAEMIALAARHGRGLPAHAVPLPVPALAAFGHAEMMAALGAGFARVDILPGPRTELEPLAFRSRWPARLPGARPSACWTRPSPTLWRRRRARPCRTARTIRSCRSAPAARSRASPPPLHAARRSLPLPAGAPYGAVLVDRDACTLCLSCVSLCPSGALLDNPDRPELRFVEDACLQCGLCANICPEDAITLQPRMDLSPAALRPASSTRRSRRSAWNAAARSASPPRSSGSPRCWRTSIRCSAPKRPA